MKNNESITPFIARRRFFLFRSFQGKLILGILGAAVLSLLLLGMTYFMEFCWMPRPWGRMEWLLRTQGPLLIQLTGFVGVLSLVALAISHRVAGPLFSLEKSMQIVRSGNLVHRVRFRRRDELPYLRDAFNGMLDSVHAKVRRDRDSLTRVRHEIDELLSKNIVDPETRSVLERLKIHLAQITREFTL